MPADAEEEGLCRASNPSHLVKIPRVHPRQYTARLTTGGGSVNP